MIEIGLAVAFSSHGPPAAHRIVTIQHLQGWTWKLDPMARLYSRFLELALDWPGYATRHLSIFEPHHITTVHITQHHSGQPSRASGSPTVIFVADCESDYCFVPVQDPRIPSTMR